MLRAVTKAFQPYLKGLTRRDLFRRGGLLAAAPALLGVEEARAAPPAVGSLSIGPDIYQSIGVRPVINCRGTYTVIGGSLELPEVRAAKDAAAGHFVQLDELMEGIAQRIAEITGAEWALVSSGCAAGLAHVTAACVTGGNPDLHVRVPDLTGFAKDEVIIPTHSRNVYDQAVRSVGVRIIEVSNVEEYEAALGPRAAMVYVFAGRRAEESPLNYDAIYSIAARKNVPVLVDAAAERLTIPNVHLQRGATLVAYSGGKCIRGPQCAGLVLGRKDLLRAAWMSSAPHHGHGRSMKVGKEESMGMLAAVEMWVERDHDAELATWNRWMDNIAARVTQVEGVSASVRQPTQLSNFSPVLRISWDAAKFRITGAGVADELLNGEPRISINGSRSVEDTNLSITAYMMNEGEDAIVADRIVGALSKRRPPLPVPGPPAGDLSGRWDVEIEFSSGRTRHSFFVVQDGNKISGTHQGDFVARDFEGTISGADVELASSVSEAHGMALSYRFKGRLEGNLMSGALDMGEYMGAAWRAERHAGRA